MFQPIQAGWVGIEPATVVMVEHFMLTYVKQLGHENPRVRASTQAGLWRAYSEFHKGMPCYGPTFGKTCPQHDTDHDRIVALLRHFGVSLAFPSEIAQVPSTLPMASCSHNWQAQQFHHMMDAGFMSVPAAITAGWPVPEWMRNLGGPTARLASALQPDIPIIRQFPSDAYAVGDGSWYARDQCGGAFAVGSITSTRVDVYHVVIPVALDHAYMVELYVAWTLLVAIPGPHTQLYRGNLVPVSPHFAP